MSKPIFFEGQQVGCLMYGEGHVLQIDGNYLSVRFDGGFESFHHDGRYMNHLRTTLYPIDQYRAIIANLPAPQPEAWKPKPGEWCWFWNDDVVRIEQFEILLPNGIHRTTKGNWYEYCAPFIGELPDHLKEVQP